MPSISAKSFLSAVLLVALTPQLSFSQRTLRPGSDPAVEQTMLRAGRSAADLGNAISALTRMGEFENVEQLLSSIGQRGFNETQKMQIASAISSSERLRIVRHPKVSGESVKAIDELFELRTKQLQSPARLDQAIEALLSANPDQALPAIRILFEGGEASTAALAQAIVNTDDGRRRDTWLRALLRIDERSGVDAIQRLALYGNARARTGAINALIRLNSDNYPTAMITALYRTESESADLVQTVADELTRRGETLPGRSAVIAELRHQLDESTRVASNGIREIGRTKAWVISKKRDAIQSQALPSWTLLFRDAADSAARLIAVGDEAPESVVRQIVAIMAYEVANDPDWGDPDQVELFYKQYVGDSMAPSAMVLQSIAHAIEADNDPAALGLIRMVSHEWASPIEWLTGSGRHVSPLVTAIDHPNSTIRFEAATAIANLNPMSPYAGSSRVRDRWVQMSRLGERGSAIILENRPEVIAAWERLMNQAGLDPTFVSTARQLEVIASTGNDIRLIISKREPKDVSAVELIDMVRRIRLTRDVPLLFYKDPIAQATAPQPEVIAVEMNAKEAQAAADQAATVPDKFGIMGGIENIEGVVEKELLYGDLDVDSTTRRELDLQVIGMSRWQDESLRAGLIRQIVRPRSVAGLYEILLESRRRQHLPPLSPIDRSRFRRIALDQLQ